MVPENDHYTSATVDEEASLLENVDGRPLLADMPRYVDIQDARLVPQVVNQVPATQIAPSPTPNGTGGGLDTPSGIARLAAIYVVGIVALLGVASLVLYMTALSERATE